MDMGLGNVNWDDYDHTTVGEYKPVPENIYCLTVTKAEPGKTSKNETKVDVEFTVTGGDFDGAVIRENYNTGNSNEKAREIAIKEVKALFFAMGRTPENDATKLMHGVIYSKVNVTAPRAKPGGGVYAPRNEIKSYMNADDAKTAMQAFRKLVESGALVPATAESMAAMAPASGGQQGGGGGQQQNSGGGQQGGGGGGGGDDQMPWD